jgi:hypothetical protein
VQKLSIPTSALQGVGKRILSLHYLTRPLTLAAAGIAVLSLDIAAFAVSFYQTSALSPLLSYLTLQFLTRGQRGAIFAVVGLAILGAGIWQLSGLLAPSIATSDGDNELVIGYRRATNHPRSPCSPAARACSSWPAWAATPRA